MFFKYNPCFCSAPSLEMSSLSYAIKSDSHRGQLEAQRVERLETLIKIYKATHFQYCLLFWFKPCNFLFSFCCLLSNKDRNLNCFVNEVIVQFIAGGAVFRKAMG